MTLCCLVLTERDHSLYVAVGPRHAATRLEL